MKIKNKITLILITFLISILAVSTFAKEESFEEANGIVEPIKYSVEEPESVRSIYLTASTVAYTSRFNELIDTLIDNGGNAVIIDIEMSGGQLAFEPKNEFLKTINPGKALNDYETVVNELHKKGLYVIARQVIFNDPYIGARRPDWRIQYKYWDGLYDYRWIDPSKPGAQYYNLMIMEEVAQLGFDEIQFDYIRFPTTNHASLEYAYDEENFDNQDVINHFLKRARIIADKYDIDLSVDTFGAVVWGDVDWKIVGQHIPTMSEIVDVIYPMTYPSHYSPGYYGIYNMYYEPYDIVHDSIERFVEKANGNAKIRPYIQGFALRALNFSEKYVADQIQAGYDAGATGFAIWNASNSYSYSWSSMNIKPTKNPPEETGLDI